MTPPLQSFQKVSWIGGWGLPPQYTTRLATTLLPGREHHVFPPTPKAVEQAISTQPDALCAYSLGTLLLLNSADPRAASLPVFLFAPVLGFCREHAQNGKVPAAQVKLLLRRLKAAPLKALGGFYQFAGIDCPAPDQLPYALDALEWGLEQLITQSVATLPSRLNRQMIVGDADPLVNPISEPDTRQTTLPAGHDLGALLGQFLAAR